MTAQQLRHAAWAFNMLPSTYAHASWLPPDSGSVGADELARPESPCHRILSPWLLREHRLTDCVHFDFSEQIDQVALLPSRAFDDLVHGLGLLAQRDRLCCVIDQIVVKGLQERYGATLLEAVLRHGGRWVAGTPLPAGLGEVGVCASWTRQAGESLLLQLVGLQRFAIAARLRLRFARPQAQEAHLPSPNWIDESARQKGVAWVRELLDTRAST